MFKLIHNENVKIYRHTRTWILALLVLASLVVMGFIVHSSQAHVSANWKQQLTQENQQTEKILQDPKSQLSQSDAANLRLTIKENQYYIDHNISPNKETQWKFVESASELATLVTIFVAVIAGDSLANEFSSGTIKLLLIRPARRTKILLAKYLSVLQFALLLVVGLFVAAWVEGGIFFGVNGLTQPYVYTTPANTVQQMPMYTNVLLNYGLGCITLVMIATISFMISSLFRSSALAITISILLLFVGSVVTAYLSRFTWDKFILFANTDLTQYIYGKPLVKGMTLSFSIWMLVAYFAVFIVVTWLAFVKRDVAA